MTYARNLAVSAYSAALAAPLAADWQAVAAVLFSALPKARTAADSDAAPMWWVDYDAPKKSAVVEPVAVLFHDGTEFRFSTLRAPSKLPRIGKACRAAIEMFRARNGLRMAVPAISSVHTLRDGKEFDAATCTALTVELRAVPGTVRGKPMTADRVAWMERELERRRAGLALAEADLALATSSPFLATLPHYRKSVETEIQARVDLWSGPLHHGEIELAMMREALAVQRGGIVDAPAVAVVEPIAAVVVPVAPVLDAEESQAMWCEAVAGSYGNCVPCEITGTNDESPAPCELAKDRKLTRNACLTAPATEPAPVPVLSTVEAVDDAWAPTAATHPIVVLCLSHKAREALMDRVQDGTFPDAERTATAGAWRVTLEDAMDLQDLTSVRFVGMPRKAYTRRDAPAPAPVYVLGAAFTITHHTGRPVTLHTPAA